MKILLYLLLGASFSVSAADLAEQITGEERQLREVRDAVDRKREELNALRETAATLEATAKVTLEPAAKPVEKPKEPKELYRNPLVSLDGFTAQKGKAEVVELPDGKAIRVDAPGAEAITRTIRIPEQRTIQVTVQMKGEKVVKHEPAHHRGTRVGGMYRHAGKTFWPAAPHGEGSFDWRAVSFKFNSPAGCDSFRLILGLAGADGTVYLRNLVIEEL